MEAQCLLAWQPLEKMIHFFLSQLLDTSAATQKCPLQHHTVLWMSGAVQFQHFDGVGTERAVFTVGNSLVGNATMWLQRASHGGRLGFPCWSCLLPCC